MERGSDRTVGVVAMVGWAVVGSYGVWEMAGQEAGDNWERPYLLFAVSLGVAVGGTVAAGWAATGQGGRPGLRRAGAGVAALAIASSLVAWAVPLWATLVAAACAVFTVAAPRARRSGLVVLAASPVVGLAVMVAAIEAEVGRQDSYGDYPAAFGLGTTTIAAGSALGLLSLARQPRRNRQGTVTAPDRHTPTAV